jgi:hypothetical protein
MIRRYAMSKFTFPVLTERDKKIIKGYCSLMGYTSVIDEKNKIAKISAFGKSMYIVKQELENGMIALLACKTGIDKDGRLVYKYTENIYLKYKEAYEMKGIFGPNMKGDVLNFFRLTFGLPFFFENQISLFKQK